jgi:hypothetical protein
VLEYSLPSDVGPLLIALICLEMLSSRFPVSVSEVSRKGNEIFG